MDVTSWSLSSFSLSLSAPVLSVPLLFSRICPPLSPVSTQQERSQTEVSRIEGSLSADIAQIAAMARQASDAQAKLQVHGMK